MAHWGALATLVKLMKTARSESVKLGAAEADPQPRPGAANQAFQVDGRFLTKKVSALTPDEGVDCAAGRAARTRRTGLRSCDGAKVKEGRLIQERRKSMMKIIAAAAFVAAPWQPAHAQAIVGSIPEEFRGDWCQENTKDNIFKPGGCKLKAGSLSIDRMTLDTGRLSCGFDSGTASDGTLQMRMLCTDPEDKESLMYGAQLKLLPGKKIELILQPMDQK